MKAPSGKYLLAFGALLLLGAVIWNVLPASSAPAPLAVALMAVQNEPLAHWHKAATVMHGSRGLCAIFAVTNTSAQDSIWFNTWALDQKVGGEWRQKVLPPYASRSRGAKACYLIDSDDVNNVYPPGRGWYYVVPWPPDIPTNAAWRLELRYGRAPSPLIKTMDRAFAFTRILGFTVFDKRRAEATLLTPEVRQ